MKRHKARYKLFFLLFLASISVYAQSVTPWITTGSKSSLLQAQNKLSFSESASSASTSIVVDSALRYQSIDGFGFCLTEGSAEVISLLSQANQDALLNELFSINSGLGISILRISIGASDLSSADYSYNDGAVDLTLKNFSLDGPDKTYLIPILKKIVQINPTIKLLATPWTAPRWMKSNQSWVGGTLNTLYYETYANYFLKYFEAMRAEGLEIWAITPQNEPLHQGNDPSMGMSSSEQTTFINSYLGPSIKNSNFSHVKIIAYDHNCDNTAYPIYVCNNSSYVDGSAFHLYAGSISALSTVKGATNKNVYFTEQYTAVGGSFSGDLGWHLQNVIIGASNNWAKAIIEWNIAGNSNAGPHTAGGCSNCLGAITINANGSVTRNVSYYIVGQVSKFVKSDASRIYSTSTSSSINTSAFLNKDKSIALLVYNSSSSAQTVKVTFGQKAFNFTLSGSSAATFVWNDFASNIASPKQNNIKIYTDQFGSTLNIRSDNAIEKLSLFSINGSELFSKQVLNGNDLQSIDIRSLSKGIYLLKFEGNNFTQVAKFIKK